MNINDPLQLRGLHQSADKRHPVDRAIVIARIISGLIGDFETITGVNPRYHLSRELSLLSFFLIFNDTICSIREMPHFAPISLSIYLSIWHYLFSLPVVFISFSISGRTRESDESDVGLQTNWYRLVSDGTARSTFCVEPVERMNYLSESLISRAMKWNVGTTSSPLSGPFLRGFARPCSGVDVNSDDTTNRDSSLLSHDKQ